MSKFYLPTDVIKKVFLDFPAKHRKEVLSILSQLLNTMYALQVIRSLVYLAKGNMEQLKYYRAEAQLDPRNVIAAAEKTSGQRGHWMQLPLDRMCRIQRKYTHDAHPDLLIHKSTNGNAPDYTSNEGKYLYPQHLLQDGQQNVVQIKLTGKLHNDLQIANQIAGFFEFGGFAPCYQGIQYVWYYLDDFDPLSGKATLQLVRQRAHSRLKGIEYINAIAQYLKHHNLSNYY